MTHGELEGILLENQEDEIIRLAMEFAISNRGNAALNANAEFRALSEACEREYVRRVNFGKSVAKSMGRAVKERGKP